MMPWRVVALDGERADVESAGVRRTVICLTAPELRVGDYVVVVGSTVVRQLSPAAGAGITRALHAAQNQRGPADDGAAAGQP